MEGHLEPEGRKAGADSDSPETSFPDEADAVRSARAERDRSVEWAQPTTHPSTTARETRPRGRLRGSRGERCTTAIQPSPF